MPPPSLLTSEDLELLRFQAHGLLDGRISGNSPLSGEQRSRYRGMGMELEELRAYQQGDDVRHIAWRTSARSHLPITKVFRTERQQRALLLVEQHPGMFFATTGRLKATCAAHATALLTFALLTERGEVGAVVAHQQLRHFGYSSGLDQGLALIGSAAGAGQSATSTPASTLLTEAQRLCGRGDTLFIISDFSRWDDSLTAPLLQLGEQRQLHAIQIIDRGEQNLPAIGKLRLRSPYSGKTAIIDSNNPVLRQQYSAAMAAQQQQIESLLQRCGVHHTRLHTDDDIFLTLVRSL